MKYGNFNVTISSDKIEIRERIWRKIVFGALLLLAIVIHICKLIIAPEPIRAGDIIGGYLQYVMPILYIAMGYFTGELRRPVVLIINIKENTIELNGRPRLSPSVLYISTTHEAISSQLMMQLPDGRLHTFTFMGRNTAKKLYEALTEVLPPQKDREKAFKQEFALRRN